MQIYEEQEEIPDENSINLLKQAEDMWKFFRRYRKWLLLMLLGVSVVFFCFSLCHYKPSYQSYVTFAVSKNQSNVGDSVAASRLVNSFPYVLESSHLEEFLREALGIADSEELPISFSASVIEDTNFLTITVNAENDVRAQQAIDATIAYYPELAYEVVGSADIVVIDRSGVMGETSDLSIIIRSVLEGTLIGVLVVFAALFLMAYNNTTVGGYEDLRKYLSISCLGTIPLTKFKKRKKKFNTKIDIKNEKVPTSFKDSINTIRARIEKEMRNHKLKTLLVSSSVPGEGKTTISLNLALSLQSRGKKVLLIDADLRHPSLGALVGATGIQKDISDILSGRSTVADAIVYHSIYKMDMILGKRPVSNALELLSSRRMQRLIDEVSDYYDYIIVDTPPASMLSDASVIAAYLDAMLYVIRQDFSKVEYITEGISLLSDSDIYVLGCVLNCAEPGLGHYGYGHYGYGKYGY